MNLATALMLVGVVAVSMAAGYHLDRISAWLNDTIDRLAAWVVMRLRDKR